MENISYNDSAISEKQARDKKALHINFWGRVVCTFSKWDLFGPAVHPHSKDFKVIKFGLCIRNVLGVISGKIHWNCAIVGVF